MRRIFYIVAFMFLGLLLSLLIHALIEIPTLAILTADADTWATSYLWQHWRLIHGVGGQALSLGGLFFGFVMGRKFWHILYVEKRYGTPKW